MSDDRPDPDALLAQLQDERSDKSAVGKKGKAPSFRVFLGMCPGVGKTFAMLQTARLLQAQGIDVVIGVVETHGRAETAELLDGLELIPRRVDHYRGVEITEMDIDAILARKPAVVLVDELAHTNAPNSRHPKRHQDVAELLDAGISVLSTLNIQHIESRADIIAELTGVTVRETVPDALLDRADEIQLVDFPPEQLRQRLSEGKVYLGERANAAAQNFFRLSNLAALRELALRYTAERAGKDFREFVTSQKRSGPQRTNERLLVAVGPSPSSESLIRWTRRAAGMLDAPWMSVTVDAGTRLDEPSRARLSRHLALVSELGGDRISTMGHDICDTLLATARERNVTQIVVGKPDPQPWWRRFGKQTLVDRLIAGSHDIDVHVVRPSQSGGGPRTTVETGKDHSDVSWRGVAIAMAVVLGVTLAGQLLLPWIGYWSVALFYLLAMVLAALRLDRVAIISMATVSALCWNLLFIPPRFTLYISQPQDMIMFAAYFVVAIAVGHVTSQLRKQQLLERERERRTATLLDFTQLTSGAPDERHAMERANKRLHELFAMPIALLRRNDHDHSLLRHPAHGSSLKPDDKEFGVAAWTQAHRRPAGKFTDTLPDSRITCLPMQTRTSIMGVLAFHWPADQSFTNEERELLEGFAAQLALVLEKEHLAFAMQRAELAEQSNRLHKSLLDSVSHELKTPLAALRAALNLKPMPSDAREAVLHGEMHAATRRLERVVNHLLDMTRIESAQVKPHMEWCDLEEVIHDTLQHTGLPGDGHDVRVHLPAELPPLHIDPVLTETMLANLLHNAAVWNDRAQPIEVSVEVSGDSWLLKVRDHGPGIPADLLPRIFEKFTRADGAPAGGTGLGLSIVRGFAKAQGATIHAENAVPHGAVFIIRFPLSTPSL